MAGSTRSSRCVRDPYAFFSKYAEVPKSTQRPSYWAQLNRGSINQGAPPRHHGFSRIDRPSSLDKRHERRFHNYFVTRLPSSSLHPDSRTRAGQHHKLPRAESTPHIPSSNTSSPAAAPPMSGPSQEMTTVRIPLRSAKHHFGVSVSRGTRPYNEDTFQAGVLEMPAFAKKSPVSLSQGRYASSNESPGADSASGDPQTFYFGVFDGHGGADCSSWLRENLHLYVEKSVKLYDFKSSLMPPRKVSPPKKEDEVEGVEHKATDAVPDDGSTPSSKAVNQTSSHGGQDVCTAGIDDLQRVLNVELELVKKWRELVGGYFRRFRPEYFSSEAEANGQVEILDTVSSKSKSAVAKGEDDFRASIESVMMHAFLNADFEFVSAQARKADEEDSIHAERALNDGDILGEPSRLSATSKPPEQFRGGSTCSVAMISTPTPTPFWHPASPCTILVSHVGDTRILLCPTATGKAVPITTDHHPSSPIEARRLRRYAATFVTDSFGEERMGGLANTRAFGDMPSKRVGVSAEPEIRRIESAPAEYSFMVLVSDGVSGTLSDQEVIDIVKEARTPEQAAKDVVSFATEVTTEGDNATCLVVRFGGWERRSEGGLGSMGTKEVRDYKREEAAGPRSRRN